MVLVQKQSLTQSYLLAIIKSFLIWSFTLTVCLLVVGFPAGVSIVAVSALLALSLQSVLPISAVLLVAGSLIGINVLLVLASAAILTLKGVHPHEVRWLNWLHDREDRSKMPIYAACPLTCELSAAIE
ncbi:MAG: hypothetical protein SVX43_00505 [Cyanobacteriota bacterium]|nr:hypothetical protein [Cyanobacteriota bacterium]